MNIGLYTIGIIGVYIGVKLGLHRDNGKENGSYYRDYRGNIKVIWIIYG